MPPAFDPEPDGHGPDWPNWTPQMVRFRPPDLGNSATFWLRCVAGLSPRDRLRLHVEREDMLRRLWAIDRSMVATAEERLELLADLALHRDLLYPRIPWPRGRRPPDHRHPSLPPAAEGSVPIIGAVLRHTCLQILARHGTLRLIEIHGWLHRYGYVVAHHHPVKALADALGHEHDCHRAFRVDRGIYRLDHRHKPPDAEPLGPAPGGDDPTVIVDPLTDPPPADTPGTPGTPGSRGERLEEVGDRQIALGVVG
ncbi:MAG TPA: hypothetical protein VK507_10665, partial [Iamia sp.]|nr:hypothetical protein [Iamia sp.]